MPTANPLDQDQVTRVRRELSHRIAQKMKREKLTVVELANRLGIHSSTIYDFVNPSRQRRNNPSATTRIAWWLSDEIDMDGVMWKERALRAERTLRDVVIAVKNF